MVLPDRYITNLVESGKIEIDPFYEECVEPASLDLHLGEEFTRPKRHPDRRTISVSDHEEGLYHEQLSDSVVLDPDDFVLATTEEYVELPDDIVAHVLGRSSLGRLGLSVHQTAGYIDPGFRGQITLELSNHGPSPIELCAGDRVCQIVFEYLPVGANEPYGHDGSQYQDQTGVTPSRMNFE